MAQINTGRPIAQYRKPIPDEPYKKWIRTQGCLTCKPEMGRLFGCHPVEAAHTRQEGQGGLGTKTDDATCIPLCGYCHTIGPSSYHAFGSEEAWAAHHGLDLEAIKADLRERYCSQ